MVGIGDVCLGKAFCLYKVDPARVATPTFIGPMPVEAYFFGLTTTCTTMYSSRDILRQTQLNVMGLAIGAPSPAGPPAGRGDSRIHRLVPALTRRLRAGSQGSIRLPVGRTRAVHGSVTNSAASPSKLVPL